MAHFTLPTPELGKMEREKEEPARPGGGELGITAARRREERSPGDGSLQRSPVGALSLRRPGRHPQTHLPEITQMAANG